MNANLPRIGRRYIWLLLVGLLGMTACRLPQTAPEPDHITVQLKWIHQAQFAGFYVAETLGYYAEENIDVTFIEGGPGIDVLEQLHTGAADVSVAAADRILLSRSLGQPSVAIATTYRRNPFILVALAASGIEKPHDLIGKTVAIGNIDGRIQIEAMMDNLNLDMSDITVVPYDLDLTPFYNGEIDVVPAFAAGSLIGMKQEHADYHLIWPSDYGVHIYSDTIVSTESYLSDNPDLTTRFLRATLRGHQTAITDAETAVSASLKYARDVDPAIQLQMVLASQPLIHTGEDQLGWMRPQIWQAMYDMLYGHEFLPTPFDVQETYSLTFLTDIYGAVP